MSLVFTEYVRALSVGREPDPELVAAAWEKLLGGGVAWQFQEIEDLTRERESVEEAHRQELGKHAQERRRLEETHDQAEQEYQQQIGELEQRLENVEPAQPLVDLPFAWLSPDENPRGNPKTITVSRAASYFALILEVTDPEPYPEYRLEIRDEPTGAKVFSSELSKTGITEVSVALPRRLLAAGEYQLRLYGLRRGQEAELVEEYALLLELE